jgi:hypothetical protein
MFFQKSHQTTHLGVVEGLVWFISFEMLDRKYTENYCLHYLTFQGLLLELIPYIV